MPIFPHEPPKNPRYPLHMYMLEDDELKSLGMFRKYKMGKPHGELQKHKPKVSKPKVVETNGQIQGRKAIDFFELANFQPKQMEAHERVMQARFILYGGAAGGGKSYFLRWEAIYQCMYIFQKYGIKNVRVGIFCEDYPALKERHLAKVQYEFPGWLGSLNMSEHEFRLAPEYGGGVIAFRNLDDPSKYVSAEFCSILVDELTKNDVKVFQFLVMRLRWADVETIDTKFIAASNPGGIGHGWVKEIWINKDYRNYPLLQRQPELVAYIKALYKDNKYVPEDYGDTLSMMGSEQLIKAYRDGSWDIFDGKFFTEFDRDVHVIDPYDDPLTLELFNQLPIYCGLDYGFRAPSSVLFARYWDGEWIIFDEIYVKEKTYEELRDLIIAKHPTVELIFADPAIWAKKDSPTSGADKLAPLALRQAMNERVMGWTILREYFRTNRIKIFSHCIHLIRTIPDMVHNEKRIEDLDTKGEDHAVDSLRYLIVTHKHVIAQEEVLTYGGQRKQVESDIEELFGEEEFSQHYTQRTMFPKY